LNTLLKGNETILFVDDEKLIVETVKELLTNLGYRVRCGVWMAETPLRFMKSQQRINIHMVILDLIMPDMGGGAVYDRLKAINPDVKVLLSSGYSIGGAAQEILDRGCNDFIQKPFNLEPALPKDPKAPGSG
jgi:two-component system cell cycle sensor histidine kinase/response regulator CckA